MCTQRNNRHPVTSIVRCVAIFPRRSRASGVRGSLAFPTVPSALRRPLRQDHCHHLFLHITLVAALLTIAGIAILLLVLTAIKSALGVAGPLAGMDSALQPRWWSVDSAGTVWWSVRDAELRLPHWAFPRVLGNTAQRVKPLSHQPHAAHRTGAGVTILAKHDACRKQTLWSKAKLSSALKQSTCESVGRGGTWVTMTDPRCRW
jgi:hypothetical protein